MIEMFLTKYKFIFTEWKYILISLKKGDIMKIHFIEYEFVLIEWKYILLNTNLFWLHENVFWYEKKGWYNENTFY